MEDDYVRCPICQFPMCDEHCVSGLEHKKVCEYLRNKGSVVVDMDKSNQIYDVVLPLKILALKKSAPERYALVTQFMDHKSERFKFEDYWIQIKETVVDVILGLLRVKYEHVSGARNLEHSILPLCLIAVRYD